MSSWSRRGRSSRSVIGLRYVAVLAASGPRLTTAVGVAGVVAGGLLVEPLGRECVCRGR